jgi:hypothetical protein
VVEETTLMVEVGLEDTMTIDKEATEVEEAAMTAEEAEIEAEIEAVAAEVAMEVVMTKVQLYTRVLEVESRSISCQTTSNSVLGTCRVWSTFIRSVLVLRSNRDIKEDKFLALSKEI